MKSERHVSTADPSASWEIRTEEALVAGVGRYRRRQRLKAGVATAALLLVVAVGVTGLAGFRDAASISTAGTPDDVELVPAVPTPTPTASADPTATPTKVPPTPVPTEVPPTPTPTEVRSPMPAPLGTYAVARDLDSEEQIPVFDEVDGEPRTADTVFIDGSRLPYPLFSTTYFGSPLVLRVTETTTDGDWLQVQVPVRPNNSTVWVRAEDFDLKWTSVRIEASTASHPGGAAGLLRVFDGDEMILEAPVTSGKASASTPAMTGWVGQVLDGFNPAYGPHIIDIGGHSDAIKTFSGGMPRMALHGTDVPEMIEERISNGALRLQNDVLEQLRSIPGLLGAPVTIHRDPLTIDGTREPFQTRPARTTTWAPDATRLPETAPKFV